MSFGDKMDIAQLVISLVTLAATIYIPERIKWEQRYSQLLSDYRGYDFAVAVQGVVQFFSKNCKGNVENISTEYSKVYSEQVESKEIDNSKILHFLFWIK